MNDLFDHILNNNTESEICERVDELKPEFVSDWEDEFDDVHEAYEEQGRGEAESQVIREAIEGSAETLGVVVQGDDYVTLFEKLAGHWNLSTN